MIEKPDGIRVQIDENGDIYTEDGFVISAPETWKSTLHPPTCANQPLEGFLVLQYAFAASSPWFSG